jgi:hypothetical protein
MRRRRTAAAAGYGQGRARGYGAPFGTGSGAFERGDALRRAAVSAAIETARSVGCDDGRRRLELELAGRLATASRRNKKRGGRQRLLTVRLTVACECLVAQRRHRRRRSARRDLVGPRLKKKAQAEVERLPARSGDRGRSGRVSRSSWTRRRSKRAPVAASTQRRGGDLSRNREQRRGAASACAREREE